MEELNKTISILPLGTHVRFFYAGKNYTGTVEAFFEYRKKYSIIPDDKKYFRGRRLSINHYNVTEEQK